MLCKFIGTMFILYLQQENYIKQTRTCYVSLLEQCLWCICNKKTKLNKL